MTERPQNMQAFCHACTLRSQRQREKDHKVQASLGYTGKSSSENTKQIKKLSFSSIPGAISLWYLYLGGKGMRISTSSRTLWVAEWILGQSRILGETLSQNSSKYAIMKPILYILTKNIFKCLRRNPTQTFSKSNLEKIKHQHDPPGATVSSPQLVWG